MECVDITSLLRETVARFEPTISKKNKELAFHIPEESIEAVVDKEAITKILSNLLNNALKYARHSILRGIAERDGGIPCAGDQ